ncbi:MAG: xanthine phosphoribosyltransferase, partial [Neisseriaceae bacterium]|nr:xanthine phosphoribosyltransferase [Neisseriaceae bacterium]
GIAPAVMLGLLLTKKPVIYVKKRLPSTMEDVLTTTVHSFTKNRDYPLSLSRQFIQPDDKFIFIDDFLAYGHAALGIIDLLSQAKAKLVGVGIVIEKGFQNGGTILREQKNIRVESLAIIKAIEENKIIFSD